MLHRFRATRERGVSAIEYSIIAALIGVVIIAVVSGLGGQLSNVFGNIADSERYGGTTPLPPDGDNPGGSDGSTGACDADGNYTGELLWMKVEWGFGTEWDQYPSGAAQMMQNQTSAMSATILVQGAAQPDSDGLDQMDWATLAQYFPTCSDSSGGSGGGDDNSSDPNCDSDGNFIGDTHNWYWTRTDWYANGNLFTDSSGSVWTGNSLVGADRYYAWEDRGGFQSVSDQGDGIGAVDVYYSNGLLQLTGSGLDNDNLGDPLLYGPGTNGPVTGQWFGFLKTDQTYTEDDQGDFLGTSWNGSPSDNGGLFYADPPNGTDDTYYDYGCSGGGPN